MGAHQNQFDLKEWLYLDRNLTLLTGEAEFAESKLSALLGTMVLGTAGGPLSQTGYLTKLLGSLCSEPSV